MSALTDALIRIGAPVLKSTIEQQIGGIGGKIAGSVIDGLAAELGTAPTEEAIVERINAAPVESTQAVQRVEADLSRIVESQNQAMQSYHGVLMADAKSEGILSRLWRPLFAVVFVICFAATVFTILWLMWTRQLGTLTQLGEVTTFLTFLFIAGCAVLGVQVFQAGKSERAA